MSVTQYPFSFKPFANFHQALGYLYEVYNRSSIRSPSADVANDRNRILISCLSKVNHLDQKLYLIAHFGSIPAQIAVKAFLVSSDGWLAAAADFMEMKSRTA